MKKSFLSLFGAISILILLLVTIILSLLEISSGVDGMIQWNMIFIGLFISSISLWILCRKQMPNQLKRLTLIAALLMLPTIRSHQVVDCDTDSIGFTPLGEKEYQSDVQFITIKPFFNALFRLFTVKSCEPDSVGYSSKNHFSFNLTNRLSVSNMYFIHFYSVLFNACLICLFMRNLIRSQKNSQ